MPDDGYQLPAFYFKVAFAEIGNDSDTSFQDVSGIGSEIEMESYVEGGENRFVHQLPKSVKHPRLVLKRGIAATTSPLVSWCREVLEGDLAQPIEPMSVLVSLMDENKEPVRVWSFSNAYPVNWEVENFNSTKNEVAIEKIELNYSTSSRED
jgi:phage tail-like protein